MNHRPFHRSWPTLLLSAMAALAVSASAQAQDDYWDTGYDSGGGGGGNRGGLFGDSGFSYGYFDLGYFNNDFDFTDENANGFGGELSIPLISSLFVKAALSYASPSNLDYLSWELGGGIGLPLTDNLDLVLEGGLAHQKLEGDVFRDLDFDIIDGYGYYLAPGLRLAIGEILELNGSVLFRDVDSQTNTAIDLKALLHLTSGVSLWGGAIFSDDVNQYGVGLRLSF